MTSPYMVQATEINTGGEIFQRKETIINTEIVYVNDGNGNLIPVEIAETIHYNAPTGNRPMDFSPTAKVGETRTYTVKISNEAMGVPSVVGGALSFAAKKKAVQILKNAIVKKLGTGFLPGLNFVSWALGAAALANALTGKSGIAITVKLKYTKHSYKKKGIIFTDGRQPVCQ